MTGQDRVSFQRLLVAHSKGSVSVAELPAEDGSFWAFLFERAAHPGRSGRTSQAAAAAERLLYRPFTGNARNARRLAAAQALSSGDRSTKRQALRFMHEFGPDKSALDAAAGAIHDSDSEVRLEAVRLLAKHPSRQTLPALLEVLATAFDIRETLAAEALVQLDAVAVPGLIRLLDEGDSRIRWRAALCLTKIAGHGTKETLPGLLRAFHDDSPDVAWVATDGLLALGPDVALDVLRSALAERLTPATGRALRHYAENAPPATVFRPLADAAKGSAVGSATLTAVGKALETLEG